MVEFSSEYEFEGPAGTVSLPDLFDDRRQLIVYHFMLFAGEDHLCDGCSMIVDGLGHLGHLAARDAAFVLTSPATRAQIESVRARIGWTVPWYSAGVGFTEDCGAGRRSAGRRPGRSPAAATASRATGGDSMTNTCKSR
ncbi:MAG TPA: DUF899 family protein [Actinophytocola sp.]|nr:DUF899 family protein [Actinophytocola sp.]